IQLSAYILRTVGNWHLSGSQDRSHVLNALSIRRLPKRLVDGVADHRGHGTPAPGRLASDAPIPPLVEQDLKPVGEHVHTLAHAHNPTSPPQGGEEPTEQSAALAGEHSIDRVDAMVVARVAQHVVHAAVGALLRVARAVDAARD